MRPKETENIIIASSQSQKLDADQTYTVAAGSAPGLLDPSKVGNIYGMRLLTSTMESPSLVRSLAINSGSR